MLLHCNSSATESRRPRRTACHGRLFRIPCASAGYAPLLHQGATMKLHSRSLLLATLSPFAFATAAEAQQTNQPAAQPAPAAATQNTTPDEETIVVTGTRRSDRTVS